MDLAKSWVTAIVVYLVGNVFMVKVASAGNKVAQGDLSTGSKVLWNVVPALLIFMFMALLSAILHSSPHRDDPTRHALAVFLVPAVMIVVNVLIGLAQGF